MRWLLSTTDLLIWPNRNVPSTTTTITEITSVLVTTWSWSERRQMLRVLPAARRTRRRTPPRIWRSVRLRVRFFFVGGTAGRGEG
ncbi:hypothetical protein ACFQ0B_02305 [Nonomuraea thailandensis]